MTNTTRKYDNDVLIDIGLHNITTGHADFVYPCDDDGTRASDAICLRLGRSVMGGANVFFADLDTFGSFALDLLQQFTALMVEHGEAQAAIAASALDDMYPSPFTVVGALTYDPDLDTLS
jgi:hypothetical protein